MDSDQINVFSACHNFKTNGNEIIGFTDSFNFEKNVFVFQFFLMYLNSEVQKLKGFGFGEISTSAKNCSAMRVLNYRNTDICDQFYTLDH